MTLPEFLYYIGYTIKKRYAYKHQKRLPHKVISIGNITAGGTGKTPAVIAITKEAKKRGFYPIILTRGYKGKAKGPCFVLARRFGSSEVKDFHTSALPHFCSSALEAGDEPVLMSEILKDVPIVKCADRYAGGMFAIENLKSQISNLKSEIVFILDDGFQHWQLFRDKNILLIDAENPFDNRRLLPVGMLREPLKEIKRVDIIILTKAQNCQPSVAGGLKDEVRLYNKTAPVFLSGHSPVGFVKSTGKEVSLKWAKDKGFFAFCGIGSPESFRKTLLSTGCSLRGFKKYSDHYAYQQGDIDNIVREAKTNGADWIVTTEKDMVRLRGMRLPENLVALTIRLAIDEDFYDETFKS